MQHRTITDRPDTDRHLGAILLDLAASREHMKQLEAKFDKASEADQSEIGDELAGYDNTVTAFVDEARRAIERDTGVSFERIAEADL